ncbi:Cyclin-dependent kinase 17, partial [Frankliniella fusca]
MADINSVSLIPGRMSLKRIRRRLSQTFRFSIEGSLSELAEHLTIEDGAEVKENGVHVLPSYAEFRKLSSSHSRILETGNGG